MRSMPYHVALRGGVQGPTGNRMAGPLNAVRELHGAFQIMRAWADVSTRYASYPALGETPKTALRRTVLYNFPEAMARQDLTMHSCLGITSRPPVMLDWISWRGED